MSYQVVIWNNAGERNAVLCTTLEDAKTMARQRRALDNRAVKICDTFGTVYHWTRVVGVKTNRWSERAVANGVFIWKK